MTPERWQQVKAVFQQALERESSERATWLAQACDGDDALRSEVTLLLDGHAKAASFIETPAHEVAADFVGAQTSLVGQQLNHYKILAPLGKGGMGEVYQARDMKLDRTVALKILPADVAADKERMQRFHREAKAASALNHPHVATIYEIGEAAGVNFIAMEYVEGQTLAAKINGQPLAINEIVELSSQIADALDEAHNKGITHRDIKPANVMLTPRGQVKVLDFGLAKITRPQSIDNNISTLVKTQSGVVMGTVPYMSPEQALGRAIDHRSDIFSLGVVLYEMTTGRLPFAGVSASEILDRILHAQPDAMARFNYDVPAELERIGRKCLEKERERRYQSARELLIDLQNLQRDSDATAPLSVQSVGLASWFKRHPLGTGMIFLAAVAGLAFGLYRLRGQNQSPNRAAGTAPRVVPITSFSGNECCPSFSPDGNQIAFAWNGEKGDDTDIYVKLIDTESPLRLTTNPAEDTTPAWSPNGRYIAFVRLSKDESGIFITPAIGGAERALYSVTSAGASLHGGLSWSPDGKLLAFSERGSPEEPFSICLLSVESLEKRRLTSPPVGKLGDSFPAFSPDGKTLAFARTGDHYFGGICLVPTAGGEPRRLTSFDERRIKAGLAWTPDGREIVVASNQRGSDSFWRIPIAGGVPERLAAGGDNVAWPAITQQGHRLAYTQYKLDTNIWRFEVPGSTGRTGSPTKLIASTRGEGAPQYSADGKKIVFGSDRSGSREIWMCASDGSNLIQLTSFGGPLAGSPRWSPDGRHIAFDCSPEGHWDIYVVSTEGGKPRRLTVEPSEEARPSWSRDGRWIYFYSNRNGAFQVWKMPAAGGPAVPVTKQGGREAFESPDGRFLYYTKDNGMTSIWRTPVDGGEEVQILDQVPQGYWAVLESGIYFLNPKATPHPAIEFFSFATTRRVQIAVVEKEFPSASPGLAVSPDGRWILLAQVDQRESDIMLMENFR